MWGNEVKKTSKINSLIGKGTVIDGTVKFSGGLHVDGTINGDVTADGESQDAALSISEGALINGNVTVPFIVINGRVNGNISSTQNLELATNSRIEGDVRYKVLQIALGAQVNGNLKHHEDLRPVRKEATPVKGQGL